MHMRTLPAQDVMRARVQNDLLDIGADLCVPGTGEGGLRVTDSAVARFEAEIATMNAHLPALRSFTLPVGSEAPAIRR
jgi:cob(I)alamin adenosyltransferase